MYFATPPSLTGIAMMLLVFALVVFVAVNTWEKTTGIKVVLLRTLTVSLATIMFLFTTLSLFTPIVIDDQAVTIYGVYGKRIALGEIEHENIKVVNLSDEPFYAPTLRTNGYGIRGYQTGWFLLKGGEKGLLFLSERDSVVYIPTTKGFALLISSTEAEDIQRRIQEAST